MLKDLQTDKCR